MSCWEPHIDLMRLLEALDTEIAATAKQEVFQACAETRWPVAEAAKEVRDLIGAVSGDPDEADQLQSLDLKEDGIEHESPGHHRSVTEPGNRTCCRQH